MARFILLFEPRILYHLRRRRRREEEEEEEEEVEKERIEI